MSDKTSYVTKLAPLIALLIFGACSSPEKNNTGQIPTVLVIGLDGISFTTFKKMQEGGHFRGFTPVVPLVASFPSISDPNWTLLMNLKPEPGYTKAFFDPTIKTSTGMGQENGSLLVHVAKEPKYEQVMDFKLDGIWEHLTTFIWTDTTSRYWLESLEKKFMNFRGRDTYFTLIVNSDILAHTEGEPKIIQYLAEIEERIDRIQARYREMYSKDLEVVLISDHGNAYFASKDIPFESELKTKGWQLAGTLSGPRDVGFYVPEILSFGAFYCQSSSSRDLALALSQVSHIHVAMYEVTPEEIHLFGDGGRSEGVIRFNEKRDLVNYEVLKGKDVLEQAHHFTKGPLRSSEYFLKSSSDKYPYAAVRIWEGFHKTSRIPASVLASAELGFVFGNKALRLLTDIRGFASAHGSLHKDETLGIFTSTKRQFPTIRTQDFRKFVNVEALSTHN